MAQLNFDANEVQPLEAFEAIPAGEYEAVITDSEMKPNKAGTGTFLELKTEIVSGECAGRKLTARLNLNNPSTKAVEMARRELSAICHAVGVLRPADSSELHNRPLLMKVKLVKRDDGTASNEVGGWRAKEAASPATPTAAANAQAVQGTAPWKR